MNSIIHKIIIGFTSRGEVNKREVTSSSEMGQGSLFIEDRGVIAETIIRNGCLE